MDLVIIGQLIREIVPLTLQVGKEALDFGLDFSRPKKFGSVGHRLPNLVLPCACVLIEA